MMEEGWKEGVMLKINLKNWDKEEVKGVRVKEKGKIRNDERIEERRDGSGLNYLWMNLGRGKDKVEEERDIDEIS